MPIPEKRYLIVPEVRLHQITDADLLAAVQCEGVLRRFRFDTLTLGDHYRTHYSPETEALCQVREGEIQSYENGPFCVHYQKDAAGVGIQFINQKTGVTAIRLAYRDRYKDGTNNASPPRYLRQIGGVPEREIPSAARLLGATNWYYSSPQFDTPPPHMHSVEFSITSSDPNRGIVEQITPLAERAGIPITQLTSFIDDPYSSIPFENPTPASVDVWWDLWYTMVQAAGEGHPVPLPGQTSMKGFEGFFAHMLEHSRSLLSTQGYTHLSGVPSWHYVWTLNLKHGFVPDNPSQHHAAQDFFSRVSDFSERVLPVSGQTNRALMSWSAVAPFALSLLPHHVPHTSRHSSTFSDTIAALRAIMTLPDGSCMTYPLAPGMNLWHSLTL